MGNTIFSPIFRTFLGYFESRRMILLLFSSDGLALVLPSVPDSLEEWAKVGEAGESRESRQIILSHVNPGVPVFFFEIRPPEELLH